MKRIPRRILTEAFKKEAVRLVQAEGLTLAEVGRNLEVVPKSLKTWIVLHQQGNRLIHCFSLVAKLILPVI